MDNNKRLSYLTLEAPREGQASYAHVHEIIAGLRRRGWDVRLFQPPYAGRYQLPPLLIRLLASFWVQLCLWIRWRRGSVLYVRGHYLAFPSAVVAWLLRIPIVHEINGPYEDVFVTYPALNRFRKILIWMQRWQYRRARKLISVTEDLCRWAEIEAGGKVRCALISNGANTELFRPDLDAPDDAPERYVVFFGGLARWHSVPVMMEAAAHEDWPQGVHLVVIGDGQCADLVRTGAAQHAHIHMKGRLDYKSVPAYVAGALAGLVPVSNPDNRSQTGVMPLKLFETLASGIPVIVADFPGQADLVRAEQCGVVIPSEDAGALARAVAAIAANPQAAKEMGARGREVIIRAHSWDARAGATDALLGEMR
jgi:glycosyltransferase involved in cell wall biosynthesis